MAVCVGCGLEIDGGGKLRAKLDPAGGITCGDNGLSVADAIATSDDAAMTCCNEAKAMASTAHLAANAADFKAENAQTSADDANASAAYRARLFGADKTQAPIDLPAPAVNTPLLIQGGSYTGVTNAAGDVVISYSAFPTALLSMAVNPGAEDMPYICALHDSGLAFAISVRLYSLTTGVALGAGVNVRLSFIAIGY